MAVVPCLGLSEELELAVNTIFCGNAIVNA